MGGKGESWVKEVNGEMGKLRKMRISWKIRKIGVTRKFLKCGNGGNREKWKLGKWDK